MAASHAWLPTPDLVVLAFRRNLMLETLAYDLRGNHFLLTGATGFFGQCILALLRDLNRQGFCTEVTIVSRDPAHFLALHPEYGHCDWLHWLRSDIRELREWPDKPVDLVLHAATSTSVVAHDQPLELFDTIVEGARRVLDLAVHNGARRILFTGSGAQYGRLVPGQPVTEDSPLACDSSQVGNVYGEAKRAQETLAAIYARQYGIETILTRCFAFSGPGLPLDGHFAIGNFVRDALFADEIVVHSSGKAVRSYLHGADLAIWLLTLLARGDSGQAYNVGSDQAISIADLARRVGQRLAPHKPVRILGQPTGLRSYYVPNIDKAHALGLDVWTSLDKSIDSMAAWARLQGK